VVSLSIEPIKFSTCEAHGGLVLSLAIEELSTIFTHVLNGQLGRYFKSKLSIAFLLCCIEENAG
jgi:hypothetical protein